MTTASKSTRQDDCLRMLEILASAPAGGLSIAEIQVVTTRTGETWSFRTINDVLCDIRSQVTHEKVRVHGQGKVTKYQLKRG
jgi:hypothetical protein